MSAGTRAAARMARAKALRAAYLVADSDRPGVPDTVFDRRYARALAALARWDETVALDRGERIR